METRITRWRLGDGNKAWKIMGRPEPHPTWQLQVFIAPRDWKMITTVRAPSAEAAKPLLIKKLTDMVNNAIIE